SADGRLLLGGQISVARPRDHRRGISRRDLSGVGVIGLLSRTHIEIAYRLAQNGGYGGTVGGDTQGRVIIQVGSNGTKLSVGIANESDLLPCEVRFRSRKNYSQRFSIGQ